MGIRPKAELHNSLSTCPSICKWFIAQSFRSDLIASIFDPLDQITTHYVHRYRVEAVVSARREGSSGYWRSVPRPIFGAVSLSRAFTDVV